MDIIGIYKEFCSKRGIDFAINDKVNPYDQTTLFCPSGMQQFKNKFIDKSFVDTISNVQSCIRMNDFEEIGDNTHLLYFNMIGLFSFREMSVKETIDFWLEFLSELGLRPDYVTIHPDKPEWKEYYPVDMRVVETDECTWSDGNISGYCTEFFIDDVEIGNIVNPLGDCIDVGFGLERLEMFVNNKIVTKIDTLKETVIKIIDSGYKPSNLKQGYVLRKILREIYLMGESINHEYFNQEIERQNVIKNKYERLKDKHSDKSKEWWYDTHGIKIDDIIGN
jgi:alanyl-tRNA synthetase